MKRLLLLIFAVVLVSLAIIRQGNVVDHEISKNTLTSIHANSQDLLPIDQTFFKPSKASQFAWQAQVPAGPVEERTQVSWWWWVIGVILAIGAGMLLYVWMKKDPKKDA